MIPPPAPPDEETRLAALYSLNILDTPPEERFDRITRLAQQLFDVPIALVSLVDATRQWFKSRQGLSVAQTPRETSFCAHAILDNGILVVPNAEGDARFCDNPLVKGDPHIRFYAGRPLSAPDGSNLGTLCIIDRQPRQISAAHLQLLDDLATLVENELGAVALNNALAKAREQEARLHDFFDNANELIQSVTPEGRITYVNRKWREALGYTDEEIARLTLFDVIHPDSREHCAESLGRVLAGEQLNDLEAIFVAKDGRQVIVSGNVNCAFEKDKPTATRGIFRDITLRRQIENALRESEQRFRQIAENVREVFWITDIDFHDVLYVSPAYEQIWGRTCQDLYQRPLDWIEGIHPEDRERTNAQFAAALRKKAGFEVEYRVLRPDGSIRYIHDRGFPVQDDAGKTYRLVGIAADITEQERRRRELIALASHELRTPLTSILGALQLLTSGMAGTIPKEGGEILNIALRNTQRLIGLLNDLLDIERMESEKTRLRKEPCETAHLLQEAADLMRSFATDKGVRVVVSPGSEPIQVNRDRILQVLTNLIGNAVKFSPGGSTISLTAGPQNGHVLFQVKDQGRGIPADKLALVFERFEQVEAADAKEKKGAGLGLAICKTIVERHGGRIWVESVPGEGSTFSFTVPAS